MTDRLSDIKIATLTKKVMSNIVGKLVEMDMTYIQEMGSEFCTFPWNEENYLLDLEGKWSLSQIAKIDSAVIGGWIASCTVPQVCHSHRVLVAPHFRSSGVAKKMYSCVETKAKEKRLERMTVEASVLNERAKSFYEDLGFIKQGRLNIRDYLISRGRTAQVHHDCLEENDGSRYCVFIKELL
ncbi:GNAT family N-acetyltransferase [Acidobacteriota bacterium]